MKASKIKTIHALMVFLVMIAFLCGMIARCVQLHIQLYNNPAAEKGAETEIKNIEVNWAELYPFTDDDADMLPVEAASVSVNLQTLDKYLSVVDSLKEKIEQYTERFFPLKTHMVLAAEKIRQGFHWSQSSIRTRDSYDLLKMQNGYLTYVEPKIGDDTIAEIGESVRDFRDFLREENIDFIYANAGSKVNPKDKQLNEGDIKLEYTNENGDKLIETLRSMDVDIIDFRDELLRSGRDWYNSYYIADHHWKTSTQLWAAGVIADKLNLEYGFHYDLSYFDKSSYTFTICEKALFGEQGRQKADLKYREDYELILPNFETDFSISIPTRGIRVTGDYKNALIDLELVEKAQNYTDIDFFNKRSIYEAFVWRNDENAVIKNNNTTNNDGKKILMITDSFAWYLSGYLAMDTPEISLIHPKFDGSIRSYIRETKPDVVILMYYENNIQPIDWTSHKSQFDLR